MIKLFKQLNIQFHHRTLLESYFIKFGTKIMLQQANLGSYLVKAIKWGRKCWTYPIKQFWLLCLFKFKGGNDRKTLFKIHNLKVGVFKNNLSLLKNEENNPNYASKIYFYNRIDKLLKINFGRPFPFLPFIPSHTGT